ncbi:MAG: hypothetical protein ABJA67_09130 [Chthonomonadales bacterium]
MPDPRDKPKMNRRQLVRTAVASCVAAAANPHISEAQMPPATPVEDTRVVVIEQSLGRKLTAAQRTAILKEITDFDKAMTEMRAQYTVPEQTEPGVIFHPHREGKHGA